MVPENHLEHLKTLAVESAAIAIEPRIQAQNAILAELIRTLVVSGALTATALADFFTRIEAASAAADTVSASGQALADTTLVLRHALSTMTTKH